jgi:hypothetical protein
VLIWGAPRLSITFFRPSKRLSRQHDTDPAGH